MCKTSESSKVIAEDVKKKNHSQEEVVKLSKAADKQKYLELDEFDEMKNFMQLLREDSGARKIWEIKFGRASSKCASFKNKDYAKTFNQLRMVCTENFLLSKKIYWSTATISRKRKEAENLFELKSDGEELVSLISSVNNFNEETEMKVFTHLMNRDRYKSSKKEGRSLLLTLIFQS